MTVLNIISLIVGGYAAIVATAALMWNILKERSRIILKADSIGLFESQTESGEVTQEAAINVSIINNSYKPIILKRVGICYGSTTVHYELEDSVCQSLKIRQRLSAGDSQVWKIPIEQHRLKENIPKYIYVEDGVYRQFRTPMSKFVREYLTTRTFRTLAKR